MLARIKNIFRQILLFFHPRPVSLAGKCRLLFGIAILLVLALALLIPYFWMGKLAEKAVLDSGRAIVNTVYERHFKLDAQNGKSPVILDESGAKKEAQSSRVKWLRFDQSEQDWKTQLSERQNRTIEQLKQPVGAGEMAWDQKINGSSETTYINLVRVNKRCLACHSSEGTAPVFNLADPVGAVLVQMPGR